MSLKFRTLTSPKKKNGSPKLEDRFISYKTTLTVKIPHLHNGYAQYVSEDIYFERDKLLEYISCLTKLPTTGRSAILKDESELFKLSIIKKEDQFNFELYATDTFADTGGVLFLNYEMSVSLDDMQPMISAFQSFKDFLHFE